jgi:hypothetical protein
VQTVKYASKHRNKLYVCNVPRAMSRLDLLEAFRNIVVGVVDLDVTMQKDQGRPGENRGFCFLEMYNQPAAEQALATLANPNLEFAGTCVPIRACEGYYIDLTLACTEKLESDLTCVSWSWTCNSYG